MDDRTFVWNKFFELYCIYEIIYVNFVPLHFIWDKISLQLNTANTASFSKYLKH